MTALTRCIRPRLFVRVRDARNGLTRGAHGLRFDVHQRTRHRGRGCGDSRLVHSRCGAARSKRSPTEMRGFWRSLTSEDQLRWLGPEKGVIHLATGAIVNAVWDLWAKDEGKPLFRLLADLEPQQIVDVDRLPLHRGRSVAGGGARDTVRDATRPRRSASPSSNGRAGIRHTRPPPAGSVTATRRSSTLRTRPWRPASRT